MLTKPVVYAITTDHSIIVSLQKNYTNPQIFLSFENFLASGPYASLGCLFIDARASDITESLLIDNFLQQQLRLPVIILAPEGDAKLAINCMKAGAFDFIAPPTNTPFLHERINNGISHSRQQQASLKHLDELLAREKRLTRRERSVMQLITQGKMNKVVAADLYISSKTVELHRAKVMRKMKASSLAELVRFYFTINRKDAMETMVGLSH